MNKNIIYFTLVGFTFFTVCLAKNSFSKSSSATPTCRICPCMLANNSTQSVNNGKQSLSPKNYNITTLNKVSPEYTKAKADSAPIIISVIPPEYYAKWRIPGSVNIPLNSVETELKNWSKDKEIILYCLTERTSTYAFAMLQTMGFKNISICAGGMKKWMECGYKTDGPGTYTELLATVKEIMQQAGLK